MRATDDPLKDISGGPWLTERGLEPPETCMSKSDEVGETDAEQDAEELRETARYLEERLSALNEEIGRRLETLEDDAPTDHSHPVEGTDRDVDALNGEALEACVADLREAVSEAEDTRETLEERIDEKLAEQLVEEDDAWPPEAGESFSFDVGSVVQYMHFVLNTVDTDDDRFGELTETLVETIGEEIETKEDIHRVSFVLWKLLVKHDEDYHDQG